MSRARPLERVDALSVAPHILIQCYAMEKKDAKDAILFNGLVSVRVM
ncbi:MAG: hypothetical protein ACK5MT_22100 [Actinomycetales bacterium]